MPEITKRLLDAKGQAIESAAQKLRQLLDDLGGSGGRIDDQIKVNKADEPFNFPGGGDDQKIEDRLKAITAQYSAVSGQFQQLNAAVNDLFAALEQPSPVSAAGLAAAAPAVVDAQRTAKPEEALNFAGFLSQMGQAVVDTQRSLDQQSMAYLAEAGKAGFMVPMAFRLPKLSGKMLFELEYDKEAGVHLIFHSRSEKEIQRNQQSIEFDIVSAPAPPDATDILRRRLSLDLVFDAAARKRVLDLNQPKDSQNALPQEALDAPSRILILRVQTAGQFKHLVIYAGGEKESNVGMWITDGQTIQVVYRFQKQNSEFEKRFREFALDLAERQQEFLPPPAA